MKIKRRELDPKTEAAIMDLTSLACGERWAGNVRTPDESYTGRHRKNGNCYHWWPETGFAPPTITETLCADGRKVRVKTTLDKSKPAPFRMLKREPWIVPSQKGFQAGSVAQFKYPIDEWWAGDSAKYAEFLLLERWDFPGVDRTPQGGPQIAWRVKWIRQHYSNGAFGHATGAEFRIPEWRLQPIMLVLDTATGKVGRMVGDELKGQIYGTRIPDYLIPGEWSGS